jgi:hypothetical protein
MACVWILLMCDVKDDQYLRYNLNLVFNHLVQYPYF